MPFLTARPTRMHSLVSLVQVFSFSNWETNCSTYKESGNKCQRDDSSFVWFLVVNSVGAIVEVGCVSLPFLPLIIVYIL